MKTTLKEIIISAEQDAIKAVDIERFIRGAVTEETADRLIRYIRGNEKEHTVRAACSNLKSI